MGYDKKNFDFAKRTIKLYRKAKKQELTKGYEFTSIVGTLLNVFSCICPNKKLLIDLYPILSNRDAIPNFQAFLEQNQNRVEEDEVKEFFRLFRNGLAHKTKENFTDHAKDGEIESIAIKTIKFKLSDLEKILTLLEEAIVSSSQGPDR